MFLMLLPSEFIYLFQFRCTNITFSSKWVSYLKRDLNQVLKKQLLQILGDLQDRLTPSIQPDDDWFRRYFFHPNSLEICQQQRETYPDHTSCWCLSRNIDRSNIKLHEKLNVLRNLFLLSFPLIKLKEWAYTATTCYPDFTERVLVIFLL